MSDGTTPRQFELVCLDMAGTTVNDGGLVFQAFSEALEVMEVDPSGQEGLEMAAYVRDTMGMSKIEVFRALFGDEPRAQAANRAFERAFDDLVDNGGASPISGAREVIEQIRAAGIKVALTTGFAASTRDRLLTALGWEAIADTVCCPGQTGRGRPHPDMILHAVLRLGVASVRAVVVVGDTASDVESGLNAGAGVVAGVLTGSADEETLRHAGAMHVVGSVRDLPDILGFT